MSQVQLERISGYAGRLRHKYRLTPYEAALAALWLAGVQEDKLDDYATQIVEKKALRMKLKGERL